MHSRNHHDAAGTEARKLLRHAAKGQGGEVPTSAPSNNEQINLLAFHNVDDRFRRIAFERVNSNIGYAEPARPVLGFCQNLLGKTLEQIFRHPELANLFHVVAQKLDIPNRYNPENAIQRLCEPCRDIDGAVGAFGPVADNHDALQVDSPNGLCQIVFLSHFFQNSH
jgi:hypothetical protein